jgi:hypothetical protein
VAFRRWTAPNPPGTGWAFDFYYSGAAPAGAYALGISDLIDMVSEGYTTGELDTGTMEIFINADVVVTTASAVGDNEFCFGFRFYDGTPTLLSSSIQSWQATTDFTEDVWEPKHYSATIPTGTRNIGLILGGKRGASYTFLRVMMDNVIAKAKT